MFCREILLIVVGLLTASAVVASTAGGTSNTATAGKFTTTKATVVGGGGPNSKNVHLTTTEYYTYTGAYTDFAVPTGVTSLSVTVTGASGGASYGGFGAVVTATLSVSPGEILKICPGGQGSGGQTMAWDCYGKGGAGGSSYGQGGGGASLVVSWSSSGFVIAGAGGGDSCSLGGCQYGGNAGCASGSSGNGYGPGGGGSQNAGGSGGSYYSYSYFAQATGKKGGGPGDSNGGGNGDTTYGGGGGSGDYGGGGGAYGSGGGGSSHYSGYIGTPSCNIATSRGSGSVIITYTAIFAPSNEPTYFPTFAPYLYQMGPSPSGPTPSGPSPSGPTPSGPSPSGPTPSGPSPSGPSPSGASTTTSGGSTGGTVGGIIAVVLLLCIYCYRRSQATAGNAAVVATDNNGPTVAAPAAGGGGPEPAPVPMVVATAVDVSHQPVDPSAAKARGTAAHSTPAAVLADRRLSPIAATAGGPRQSNEAVFDVHHGRGVQMIQQPAAQQDLAMSRTVPPPQSASVPLPPGWIAQTDPASGAPFFVYTPTGHTQWNLPV
jgi:hypothetical protein